MGHGRGIVCCLWMMSWRARGSGAKDREPRANQGRGQTGDNGGKETRDSARRQYDRHVLWNNIEASTAFIIVQSAHSNSQKHQDYAARSHFPD